MTELDKSYDVIIIGGSLVGLSFAQALQSKNLRIAILEKKPKINFLDPNFDTRSIALTISSQRFFEATGLWSALAEGSYPIQCIHVSDKGRFGATRFRASELNVDALGYMVPVPTLLACLTNSVSQFSDIYYEVEMIPDGTQASLIVAADGAQSAIRRQLGIQCEEHDYQKTAIVFNIELTRTHQQVAYERFTEDGLIAMLPLSDHRVSCVWVVPCDQASDLLALDEHAFSAALVAQFGYRLGRFVQLGQRQSFPLHSHIATKQVSGHYVLLGNAAYNCHPVGGQGFNLSLRDVAVLAEQLHKQSSIHQALQDYCASRVLDQRHIQFATHQLPKIFNYQNIGLTLLRDIGLMGLDNVSIFKRHFARRAMGLHRHAGLLNCGIPLE